MIKNCRKEIRLSSSELNLILTTASKFNMDFTSFVLSVVVPYCVKANGIDNVNVKSTIKFDNVLYYRV